MTQQEILKVVEERKIKFIQMQFINVHGQLHAIEIPVERIQDMIDGQIMFDGSSIAGYSDITTSDLCLKPDLSTFLVLDFEHSQFGGVARFICDIYKKDGTHFSGDPRATLKKVCAKIDKMGMVPYIGLEAEFFLLKRDEKGNTLREYADETGYFSVSPLDNATQLKREIVATLERHGYEIEALHKEVAQGQHEINSKYDTALKTADKIITFKWIVKNIANKYGLTATFMPKPFHGINGSGMHTNISLFDKSGNNLFFDKTTERQLSNKCEQFMTGILNRSVEIAAATNPAVNSYKRLIPGYEAPNCVAWSDSNRSAMIRVPASRGMGTRCEVRNPDPTANPYIYISLLLEAGLEGIENNVTAVPPVYENLFKLSLNELFEKKIDILPGTLGESLLYFQRSEFAKRVLGDHQHRQYFKHKWDEWDAYRQIVHTWEFDKYKFY